MNKTFLQKLRDFFCCGRYRRRETGDGFVDGDFSLDTESHETEHVEKSSSTTTTQETKNETKETNDMTNENENKKSETKTGAQAIDSSIASFKDEIRKSNSKIKTYVMNKLDMTPSQLEEQKRRKKLKQMAEKDMSTTMTANELDDIISTVTDEPEDRIKKLDRVLSSLKQVKDDNEKEVKKAMVEIENENIQTEPANINNAYKQEEPENISGDLEIEIKEASHKSPYPREGTKAKDQKADTLHYPAEPMSLRNTKIEMSVSNSCESLTQFKRTVKEETSSNNDSEITCLIKNYDTTEYNKILAKKMQNHLKKSKK